METISNAMDVGNPSNFVRMVRFFNDDWNLVREKVSGYFFNDEEVQKSMREVFGNTNYVLCPHTAVAFRGLEQYRQETSGDFTGVFLSTAHPAKFIDLVEETLGRSIDVPERLKSLLSIEKVSIKMKPSFDEFKTLLMN
jgi:threonine synthase